MSKRTVVSVADKIEVEAIRLNDDGEGVVSIHGFTVFVPGLLPGERALVQIQSTGKSFGRAMLLERFNASPERVNAPCPVFERCGGCQLQHLPYDIQLAHKRQTVLNALRRVGRFRDGEIEVLPTLGMDEPWRYRNNVQVPIRFNSASSPSQFDSNEYPQPTFELGFYAPESHTLVPTDVCLLEPSLMEQTARIVAQALAERLGSEAKHIHHLILRQSFTDNELMVVLAVDSDETLADVKSHLGRHLLGLPGIVSVAMTVQPDFSGSSVWGEHVEVLAGREALRERLGRVEYLISPRSFFQVNPVQAFALYQHVKTSIQLESGDKLLDAYCGTGTIALWLANSVESVVGIESIADAVVDARRNAEHNGIQNASFLVGRVEEELTKLTDAEHHFDVVVLDPPRKGCDKRVLSALLTAKPRQIAYVSCNPSTLARDLRILKDGGYSISLIQPVDMFPETSHVECVVHLQRDSEENK